MDDCLATFSLMACGGGARNCIERCFRKASLVGFLNG